MKTLRIKHKQSSQSKRNSQLVRSLTVLFGLAITSLLVGDVAVAQKGKNNDSDSSTTNSSLKGDYPDPKNSKKVIICHVPPGNPDNPQTLSINASGLNGHANHPDVSQKSAPLIRGLTCMLR